MELPGSEATGWPRTTIPDTADPAVPPEAAFIDARAEALAEIELTVTSPPKSERPEIEAEAAADAVADAVPLTLDETESARATEPSAGYANAPPTPTASGGPDTAPAIALPCPGTATWIANASALDVPPPTAEDTPLDPVSARTAAAPQTSAERRTTPGHYSRPCGRPSIGPLTVEPLGE
jgi:hypothetical protein